MAPAASSSIYENTLLWRGSAGALYSANSGSSAVISKQTHDGGPQSPARGQQEPGLQPYVALGRPLRRMMAR